MRNEEWEINGNDNGKRQRQRQTATTTANGNDNLSGTQESREKATAKAGTAVHGLHGFTRINGKDKDKDKDKDNGNGYDIGTGFAGLTEFMERM